MHLSWFCSGALADCDGICPHLSSGCHITPSIAKDQCSCKVSQGASEFVPTSHQRYHRVVICQTCWLTSHTQQGGMFAKSLLCVPTMLATETFCSGGVVLESFYVAA